MKKILAVSLALLMLLALVACNNTPAETESDTSATPVTDTEPAVTESEVNTETETETAAETEEIAPPADNIFVDRDETVYVNGANVLNVRSANAIQDGNVVGTLKEGDSVKRVGYNETWSKIEFGGNVCFASSKYLSTKAPATFDDVEETVYVKVENTVTLREKPWAESEALASLTNGISLVRTGVAKEADEFGSSWSRVNFINKNGETVEGYVNSKFLTTSAPVAFAEVDETVIVTNCETLNLRAEASLTGKVLESPAKGTEIQRIGVAASEDDEGITWSMLMYKGIVCYASSNYLVVKADVETEASTETEETAETTAVAE